MEGLHFLLRPLSEYASELQVRLPPCLLSSRHFPSDCASIFTPFGSLVYLSSRHPSLITLTHRLGYLGMMCSLPPSPPGSFPMSSICDLSSFNSFALFCTTPFARNLGTLPWLPWCGPLRFLLSAGGT